MAKHLILVDRFNPSGSPSRGVVVPMKRDKNGQPLAVPFEFITARANNSGKPGTAFASRKEADINVPSAVFGQLAHGATLQMNVHEFGNEPFSVTDVTVTKPFSTGIDFHFGPIRGHWWFTATRELIPQIRFNFELVLFERRRICTTFESATVTEDVVDMEELGLSADSQLNGSSTSNEKIGVAAPVPAPAS